MKIFSDMIELASTFLEVKRQILNMRLLQPDKSNDLVKEYLQLQIEAIMDAGSSMTPLVWKIQKLYLKEYGWAYEYERCMEDSVFVLWLNDLSNRVAVDEYSLAKLPVKAINSIYENYAEKYFAETLQRVYESVENPSIDTFLLTRGLLRHLDNVYDGQVFENYVNKSLSDFGLDSIPEPVYDEEIGIYIDIGSSMHEYEGRFYHERDLFALEHFNSLREFAEELCLIYNQHSTLSFAFSNFPLDRIGKMPQIQAKKDLKENSLLLFLYLYARASGEEFRVSLTKRREFFAAVDSAISNDDRSIFFDIVRKIRVYYFVKRGSSVSHLDNRLFDLFDDGGYLRINRIEILKQVNTTLSHALGQKVDIEIESLRRRDRLYFPSKGD